MASPQYGLDGESSDHRHGQMIYYTYHMETVAPHYVCVDVSSDHSGIWMIYYTLHKKTDVLK